MRVIKQKQLEIYETEEGKQPFVEWLESLSDKTARYRIKERLDRVALGNLGDYKLIKKGVAELRLSFGPGYRIYYAEDSDKIILLLCGGNKSTQSSDIKKAVAYWEDYLSR
jgi:putative addiction module killer protein